MFNPEFSTVEATATAILLLVCSICDMVMERIPNKVIFPAMLISLGWCIYIVTTNAWSGGLRLLLCIAIFAFGALDLIGLGDIKVFMTMALLNHPVTTLLSIAVGAVAFVLVQMVSAPKETWNRIRFSLLSVRLHATKAIPKLEESTAEKRFQFVPCLMAGYGILILGGVLLKCV